MTQKRRRGATRHPTQTNSRMLVNNSVFSQRPGDQSGQLGMRTRKCPPHPFPSEWFNIPASVPNAGQSGGTFFYRVTRQPRGSAPTGIHHSLWLRPSCLPKQLSRQGSKPTRLFHRVGLAGHRQIQTPIFQPYQSHITTKPAGHMNQPRFKTLNSFACQHHPSTNQ